MLLRKQVDNQNVSSIRKGVTANDLQDDSASDYDSATSSKIDENQEDLMLQGIPIMLIHYTVSWMLLQKTMTINVVRNPQKNRIIRVSKNCSHWLVSLFHDGSIY